VSRNQDLSQLLATRRIAERQGVGVDRMFADMIRHGHPSPVIEELDGVAVRTVLAGERPDQGWIEWIAAIEPDPRRDLRILMTLHHLATQRWTDPIDLAPVLQLPVEEARQTIERLLDLRRARRPVCHEIDGIPLSAPVPSIAMDAGSIEDLGALRRAAGTVSRAPSREQIARSYARARGRISTTELGSIVGAARANVGGALRALEQQGELEPSRQNRRGAGFYYRYTGDEEQGS
jgi:ATP-dependent DNA helicase RecG